MPKLDDITIGNYQIIASNMASAFVPYYGDVADLYSDTEKGVGKVVKEQQIRIADVMGLLGRVLGRGVTLVTQKELEKLNNLLNEIKEVHKQVSEWVKEGAPYLKDSEKAIKGLSISVEDIKTATDTVKKKEKVLRRAAGYAVRHPFFAGIFGTLGYKATSLLRGLSETLGSIAGPLQPLIAPALGLTGAAVWGAWKLGKLAKRGPGMLQGKSPLEGGAISPGPSIGRTIPAAGLPSGIEVPRPGSPIGIEVPRPGVFRALSRRKKEELTDPLFYFFNKRAYRAGWTRDVLKALTGKKITGGGGGVGEGIVGGVIGGALVSLALLAAKITGLGIVAAGAVWGVSGLVDSIKDILRAEKGDLPKKPTWWQKLTPLGALLWGGTEYHKNPEMIKKVLFGGKPETSPLGALEIPGTPETPMLVIPKPQSILETPPGKTSEWISGLIDEFIRSQKELIEALQNQAQPAVASTPLFRSDMGQRSIDEDPLMDKLSRGEYQRQL